MFENKENSKYIFLRYEHLCSLSYKRVSESFMTNYKINRVFDSLIDVTALIEDNLIEDVLMNQNLDISDYLRSESHLSRLLSSKCQTSEKN